jgi:hypothetical protein
MMPLSRISVLFALAAAGFAAAQDAPKQVAPEPEKAYTFHYALAVLDDATFDSDFHPPLPASASPYLHAPTVTLLQNQFLVEPSFTLRYRSRWNLSSSLVGIEEGFHGLSAAEFGLPPGNTAAAASLNNSLDGSTGAHTQERVRETYAGLSAGDFDFTLGRRIVHWGTGYAFSPAGVLDPPRTPTNPTDRLNINEGRDMVKADYVHGQQAVQLAWSSAALAPANSNMHDTAAFRYNALIRGFDTSLIASSERGGDSVGALTFTRVLGQAWEVHGEAVWREEAAILLGAKYITASGLNFYAEFYTPPNIAYYRDIGILPTAGRQHYAFLYAGKSRLRELPGWKQWDLDAYLVANLNDRSTTAIVEATRRFGNHFSSYLHMEVPEGGKGSEYGSTPYTAATSMGVRFQL